MSEDSPQDQTSGQFTTVKLQALLDSHTNPKVFNRRELAIALADLGARITVHAVEAWFRRVDSNYSHQRPSLNPSQPSFALPGRHWPLLLEIFSLAAAELERNDDDFVRFCLAAGEAAGEAEVTPLDRSNPTHLPGRDWELSELLSEVSHSDERGACMVLLEGAPGLGKTALIEELVRRTRASNRLCLTASCGENSYVPLLPLLDLVRLQRADVARGGPEALRLAQELLARIELANQETFNKPPGSTESTSDTQSSLFLLVSDLLVALARHAPLLLVVDDVHWLDATSRDLLLHFARFLRLNREHRVLMVFAGRGFSRELLHQLPTGEFTRKIALKPLERAAMRRAAQRQLGSDLAEVALDYVWNITRGNPLYVEQLCAHLLSSHQLEMHNGKLALTAPADAIHVPETLDDFYRRRFDALDQTSGRLLQLAACVGLQINADFLQLLMPDLENSALLSALEHGEESGLLKFVNKAYEFCHPVARHAVYMAMTEAQRSRQHAMVATTISQSLPDPTPHASIELAYHLVRGQPFTNAQQTMHACRVAANHSHNLSAWPSTDYFVTNALELDESGKGLSDEQRGLLLRLRGTSHHQMARPAIALQDLSLALKRFQSAQNTEEYTRTLSQVVRIRSNFSEWQEGSAEAAEELSGYIDLLGGPDNLVAADALEVLASFRLANNDSREAKRLAMRVLSTHDGAAQPSDSIAKSQITVGLACLNHLDVQGALTHLLAATRSARESYSEPTLVRALQRLVFTQLVMGRIDEVFVTYSELQQLKGSTATGEHSAVCAAVSAALAVRGNFDESLAVVEDGLELVDVTGYRFMETALVGTKVFNLIQLGSFASADAAIARLEVDRPRRAAELLRNCVARAADPSVPQELSETNRLSALTERAPDVGELARVMMLAELAIATRDEEVLLGLLPKLRSAETSGVLFVTAWPVQLPLLMGRIYILLEKKRDAHYYLRKSLDFGRSHELPAQLRITKHTLHSEWSDERELVEEAEGALAAIELATTKEAEHA